MDEGKALRQYVARQLEAGTPPHVLQAELVRFKVPENRAYALIREINEQRLARAARQAAELAAEQSSKALVGGMGRPEFRDYIAAQRASGLDPFDIFHQLRDYGWNEAAARELLAEAGVQIEEPLPTASVEPSGPGEKGQIHSLYTRIPISKENAEGRLTGEQRRLLAHAFWRSLGLLVLVLGLEAAAVSLALLLGYRAGEAPIGPAACCTWPTTRGLSSVSSPWGCWASWL